MPDDVDEKEVEAFCTRLYQPMTRFLVSSLVLEHHQLDSQVLQFHPSCDHRMTDDVDDDGAGAYDETTFLLASDHPQDQDHHRHQDLYRVACARLLRVALVL